MAARPPLDGPRLPPLSGGSPRQLVVLLHGYGADGFDLIPLGEAWRRLLPDAAFVAPHAPEPCTGVPMGRQWFPLSLRDLGEVGRGLAGAVPILDAFLDAELARHGLPPQATALVGFSQGAMMALDAGPARPGPVAGILSYSGLVARPLRVAHPGQPPVLLFHGAEDPLIPAAALHRARAALTAAGLPVEAELRAGLGHGIDEAGLAVGGRFLARVLGLADSAGRARRF